MPKEKMKKYLVGITRKDLAELKKIRDTAEIYVGYKKREAMNSFSMLLLSIENSMDKSDKRLEAKNA